MVLFSELTDNEKLLIPEYREFWYRVAISTSQLNHDQVKAAIFSIYTRLGLKAPRIHYCSSLPDLLRKSHGFFQKPSFCEDGAAFASQEMAKIHEMVIDFTCNVQVRELHLSSQLRVIDGECIDAHISDSLLELLSGNLPESFINYRNIIYFVFPRLWYVDESCWFDFHFSAVQRLLPEGYDEESWQVFRQLVEVGSWFTAFESDCFICERPLSITLECENKIIASMTFNDGESIILEESREEM